MTDDESNQSDEEQTQYGGTEDQEPTTEIEDEDERTETDNEGADK